MTKVMTVEGMMCGMCEAHVNDALRKVPGVKKASASRTKKLVTIECDDTVADEALLKAVNDTGYEASDVRPAPGKKGGLRGLFGKK